MTCDTAIKEYTNLWSNDDLALWIYGTAILLKLMQVTKVVVSKSGPRENGTLLGFPSERRHSSADGRGIKTTQQVSQQAP